jgi:ribosomal-protein-alanine N-acetyltransferase
MEDLDELYRIDKICFEEFISFARTEFAFLLNHPEVMGNVAEGVEGIMGFILGYIEGPICAHILTLDVLPDFRRRNIGTLLMNSFHKDLEKVGMRAFLLEVGTRNNAAQHLYSNLQYEYAETLTGYYCGKEDAYRMIRRIRP